MAIIETRILFCDACSHIGRMTIDVEDMPPPCPCCDADGTLYPASAAQIAFRAAGLEDEEDPPFACEHRESYPAANGFHHCAACGQKFFDE